MHNQGLNNTYAGLVHSNPNLTISQRRYNRARSRPLKNCSSHSIHRPLFTSLKWLGLVTAKRPLWEVVTENGHSSSDKGLKKGPRIPLWQFRRASNLHTGLHSRRPSIIQSCVARSLTHSLSRSLNHYQCLLIILPLYLLLVSSEVEVISSTLLARILSSLSLSLYFSPLSFPPYIILFPSSYYTISSLSLSVLVYSTDKKNTHFHKIIESTLKITVTLSKSNEDSHLILIKIKQVK